MNPENFTKQISILEQIAKNNETRRESILQAISLLQGLWSQLHTKSSNDVVSLSEVESTSEDTDSNVRKNKRKSIKENWNSQNAWNIGNFFEHVHFSKFEFDVQESKLNFLTEKGKEAVIIHEDMRPLLKEDLARFKGCEQKLFIHLISLFIPKQVILGYKNQEVNPEDNYEDFLDVSHAIAAHFYSYVNKRTSTKKLKISRKNLTDQNPFQESPSTEEERSLTDNNEPVTLCSERQKILREILHFDLGEKEFRTALGMMRHRSTHVSNCKDWFRDHEFKIVNPFANVDLVRKIKKKNLKNIKSYPKNN